MQREGSVGEGLFQIVKGTGLALLLSLVSALLFAVLLRCTYVPDSFIYPVNQTLKAVCITVGALVFVRGEKGFVKGGAIALLFTALSYLAFSAIGNDFSLSWLIFAELFLGLFVGALSGIIAVNIKR